MIHAFNKLIDGRLQYDRHKIIICLKFEINILEHCVCVCVCVRACVRVCVCAGFLCGRYGSQNSNRVKPMSYKIDTYCYPA